MNIVTKIKIMSPELRIPIIKEIKTEKPLSKKEILSIVREDCEYEALFEVNVEVNASDDESYKYHDKFGIMLDSKFDIGEVYKL